MKTTISFIFIVYSIVILLLSSYNIKSVQSIKSTLNGKIWHITDVHYDWNYVSGGNTKNMCHSPTSNKKKVTVKSSIENRNTNDKLEWIDILQDNDVDDDDDDGNDYYDDDDSVEKPSDNDDASPYGNYRCDSPLLLVQSAFKKMVEIESEPDFILWSGDDVPHVSTSELNQTLVLQSILNMTNFISDYFPGIPVYPSIGNHDSFPEHQISVGPNWLLDGVADMWSRWLTNDSLTTIRIGGYYSEEIMPGFRIVSLNTVFYYAQDKQCVNLTDPANQLSWLNQTLYQARLDNEQVLILGHVPPGHNEKYNVANFHSQFNDPYLYAFSNYSDIIIAHIYGHEHTDTFRLYYNQPHSIFNHNSDWVPNGVMFLSPSITPWMDPYIPALPNNPSIRMFTYNTTSFGLTDYYQYWSNLTSNIEADSIDWMLEYRATEFYHVAALDPLSMYEAYLLLNQDTEMLNLFHFYNSVSYPTHACDAVCQKIQLCSILHLYNKGFAECLLSP